MEALLSLESLQNDEGIDVLQALAAKQPVEEMGMNGIERKERKIGVLRNTFTATSSTKPPRPKYFFFLNCF